MPELRALRLGECAIDDAGIAKLVAHPRFVQLETLELDRNRLTAEAGAILARAPRLPQRLLLSGNALGDAGASALAKARVVDLDLEENGITDEGARVLVEHLTQVASLRLAGNPLSDGMVTKCRHDLGARLG